MVVEWFLVEVVVGLNVEMNEGGGSTERNGGGKLQSEERVFLSD